jgi:uncharacterized membrane protein YhiD involved in acid resistance
LNSPKRQLTLAVASGAIATVSTYMAASIWVDSNSTWIAAGAILQGLGTLLTLILLVWQIISLYTTQEDSKLDQLLTNLTEPDPLKRVITVRQLAKLVTRAQLDSSMQRNIAECLRLLLNQEQEAVIREAVFDSLQALDQVQEISSGTPLATPLALKRSTAQTIPHKL